MPFRPDKTGLIEITRRVQAIFARGDRIAIAPEGRIHAGERVVLPLDEGVAYFALRAGVPIVPVGIIGHGVAPLRRHGPRADRRSDPGDRAPDARERRRAHPCDTAEPSSISSRTGAIESLPGRSGAG